MMERPKSKFETKLDKELLDKTSDQSRTAVEFLLGNKALEQLMGFCNVVSIERMGINDHGRVHAKITTLNALKIIRLLQEGGVEPNLVKEGVGGFEDARLVVAVSGFLHDLGMSVGRQEHETNSVAIGDPFILGVLRHVYRDESMIFILRSYIFECILGHMGHLPVSSIESGIILVADGCDMEYGRARVAAKRRREPHVGDIHAHSALSVTNVELVKGEKKPLQILIQMKDATGIFQVEEVLMGKIAHSAIRPYIELSVQIGEEPKMYYLK